MLWISISASVVEKIAVSELAWLILGHKMLQYLSFIWDSHLDDIKF